MRGPQPLVRGFSDHDLVDYQQGGSGGGGPSIADGYWFQVGLLDPRTAVGWAAAAEFHDLAEGDRTTGKDTGIVASTNAYVAFLIAKQALMSFDEMRAEIGYTNICIILGGSCPVYGSNNLVAWTQITFDGIPGGSPFHGGVFGFETMSASNSTDIGPYRYLAGVGLDNGVGNTRSFITDLRVKNNGVDVGP